MVKPGARRGKLAFLVPWACSAHIQVIPFVGQDPPTSLWCGDQSNSPYRDLRLLSRASGMLHDLSHLTAVLRWLQADGGKHPRCGGAGLFEGFDDAGGVVSFDDA